MKCRDVDYSLQSLLDLNGKVYFMDGGWWVKFEAYRVAPTRYIPHGISYSLTLHDRTNTRIVGYDNAHKSLPKTKRYKAKKVTWDHVHKTNRIESYEFYCTFLRKLPPNPEITLPLFNHPIPM